MIVPMKLWANWAWFGHAVDPEPCQARSGDGKPAGLLGSFERLMAVQADLVLKNLED